MKIIVKTVLYFISILLASFTVITFFHFMVVWMNYLEKTF